MAFVMNSSAKIVKMTQKTYDRLMGELEELATTKRMEISKKVNSAFEFGDTPENASWDATSSEEWSNETRIKELRLALEHAEIVQNDRDATTVSIGNRVTLEINGKIQHFELVDTAHTEKPTKTNTLYRPLSVDSPIGRAISGQKMGYSAKIALPSVKAKSRIKIISLS
jgi:transcription elongation factor GreA